MYEVYGFDEHEGSDDSRNRGEIIEILRTTADGTRSRVDGVGCTEDGWRWQS